MPEKGKKEKMKDIIIVIFVLIAIFCCNMLVQKHLENTSQRVISKLEVLKEKTIEMKDTEEREELKKHFAEIENEWNRVHKTWSIIVMHEELDNIEEALIKTKSSINDGDLENSLAEIETAMFFINHVLEREKVTLENIF